MGKITKLLDQSEKFRYEFYRDAGGKVHQIARTEAPEGHHRIWKNSDASDSGEDYISPDEYASIKKSAQRVGIQ